MNVKVNDRIEPLNLQVLEKSKQTLILIKSQLY